jgi:hypothetical protein
MNLKCRLGFHKVELITEDEPTIKLEDGGFIVFVFQYKKCKRCGIRNLTNRSWTIFDKYGQLTKQVHGRPPFDPPLPTPGEA